ncbi:MAG: phosphoribosylaminoimidazolesuccinocarboxamide synthase [Thermoplasmata archaeon]
MEMIRSGKVKDVYDAGDHLVFKFSDRISVFDKIIPSPIPDKGRSLCRTSAFWFNLIAQTTDLKTHFLSLVDDKTMNVRKFNVINTAPDRFRSNYVIPLEFVTRYYVAGSLMDRIKSGSVDYRTLGFRNMPEYGEELPDPYFEMTTKHEKFDRPLTREEAAMIGGLSNQEIDYIRECTFTIDRRIQRQVSRNGLIHADGKKEYALDLDRSLVVVDTFGTADEDRFWDVRSYNEKKIVELSKESVRQYYRDIGYHDDLYSARSSGLKEPDIPDLPGDMIEKTSSLYRKMYELISGNKW